MAGAVYGSISGISLMMMLKNPVTEINTEKSPDEPTTVEEIAELPQDLKNDHQVLIFSVTFINTLSLAFGFLKLRSEEIILGLPEDGYDQAVAIAGAEADVSG